MLRGMTPVDALGLWPEFSAPSWRSWKTFLCGLFALPMSESERATFVKHTGRQPRERPFTEAWVIAGRRAGKSRISAFLAVFLALFVDHSNHLASGERGTVMVLAADRKQARQIMGYVRGFIRSVPMLQEQVENDLREALELKNNTAIEVHTASFRSTRGYSAIAVICDEVGWWRDDTSSNPDREILNALRPALLTPAGTGLLLAISTPFAKRGALFDAFDEHYGREGSDVLVYQADTRSMNPTVPEELITRAYDRDSEAASAEYGAVFRSDVSAFVDPAALAAVIISGRFELPPEREHRYYAFCDPSGGRADSMTVAIGHRVNGIAVLDATREFEPPFSPQNVVKEICDLLKAYGLYDVTGDSYSAAWVEQEFARHGVRYKRSKMPKSDLYVSTLALINSGQCELLDIRRMRLQFESLDRRTARSGKDSVDHPSGAHDDLCNAVAGCLVGVGTASRRITQQEVLI